MTHDQPRRSSYFQRVWDAACMVYRAQATRQYAILGDPEKAEPWPEVWVRTKQAWKVGAATEFAACKILLRTLFGRDASPALQDDEAAQGWLSYWKASHKIRAAWQRTGLVNNDPAEVDHILGDLRLKNETAIELALRVQAEDRDHAPG